MPRWHHTESIQVAHLGSWVLQLHAGKGTRSLCPAGPEPQPLLLSQEDGILECSTGVGWSPQRHKGFNSVPGQCPDFVGTVVHNEHCV